MSQLRNIPEEIVPYIGSLLLSFTRKEENLDRDDSIMRKSGLETTTGRFHNFNEGSLYCMMPHVGSAFTDPRPSPITIYF